MQNVSILTSQLFALETGLTLFDLCLVLRDLAHEDLGLALYLSPNSSALHGQFALMATHLVPQRHVSVADSVPRTRGCVCLLAVLDVPPVGGVDVRCDARNGLSCRRQARVDFLLHGWVNNVIVELGLGRHGFVGFVDVVLVAESCHCRRMDVLV